jgi:hypothetical protein
MFGNSWQLLWWLLAQMPRVVKTRLMRAARSANIVDIEGITVGEIVVSGMGSIIGKSFHPRPLDASGVLIRAKFPGVEKLPGHDFTNGWGNLFARGLDIIQAKGDHFSMVNNENIAALARQINALIDRGSGDVRSTGAFAEASSGDHRLVGQCDASERDYDPVGIEQAK